MIGEFPNILRIVSQAHLVATGSVMRILLFHFPLAILSRGNSSLFAINAKVMATG